MNPVKPLTPKEAAYLIMLERNSQRENKEVAASLKRRMKAARKIEAMKDIAELFD